MKIFRRTQTVFPHPAPPLPPAPEEYATHSSKPFDLGLNFPGLPRNTAPPHRGATASPQCGPSWGQGCTPHRISTRTWPSPPPPPFHRKATACPGPPRDGSPVAARGRLCRGPSPPSARVRPPQGYTAFGIMVVVACLLSSCLPTLRLRPTPPPPLGPSPGGVRTKGGVTLPAHVGNQTPSIRTPTQPQSFDSHHCHHCVKGRGGGVRGWARESLGYGVGGRSTDGGKVVVGDGI